jgi:hypothetical protein
VKQFKVPLIPILTNTTVTTGVINTTYPLQAADLQNFATRFGALFEEYRIVKVKYSYKPFSVTNPGLLVHWIDEKQAAAPTSAEALQKSNKQFAASNQSPHTLVWVSNDPLDLQYIDIGTTNTVLCSYKVYSDNANFGSSIVVTSYGVITGDAWVQFRGLN